MREDGKNKGEKMFLRDKEDGKIVKFSYTIERDGEKSDEVFKNLKAVLSRYEDCDKSWKPRMDESYYSLIGDYVGAFTWTNCDKDITLYLLGNCFPSWEEANKFRNRLFVLRKLKDMGVDFTDWDWFPCSNDAIEVKVKTKEVPDVKVDGIKKLMDSLFSGEDYDLLNAIEEERDA